MNVLNKFQYHICDVEFQKKSTIGVHPGFAKVKKKNENHITMRRFHYLMVPLLKII